MIISQQPKVNHSGFNPIVIKMSSNVISDYTIRIYIGYNNKNIYVNAEFFNGVATFDISGIIKNVFTEFRSLQNSVPKMNKDFYYCVPYLIDFPANVETGFPQTIKNFNAYRGSNQIGKKLIDFNNFFFGTYAESIKVYQGFTTEVACIHGLHEATITVGDVEYLDTNTHIFTEVPTSATEIGMSSIFFDENITTEQLEAIVTDGYEPIQVMGDGATTYQTTIPVILECTPINPFYVKWDNKRCGIDYWMFTGKKFESRKGSNDIIFKNYYENSETARKDKQKISTEIVESISVGAIGINNNEYKVLSELIDSTNIKYFDTDINDWVSIILVDSNIENDTENPTKSCTFTFEFPTPQIIS